MRFPIRTLFVPLALIFPCFGQVVSAARGAGPGSVNPVQVGSGGFAYTVTMYNSRPITGRPYSAESIASTIKTLPGGITITQPGVTQKLWRDTLGRTRTERQTGVQLAPNAPSRPTIVEIRDPVAGIGYVLDQSTQTAYRLKMAPLQTLYPDATLQALQSAPVAIGAPRVQAQSVTNSQGIESKMEPLGTQLMEGLEVTGMRQTTVYPVNFDGNDRPITVTTENWFSTSLGVSVLTRRNDPRSGEYTGRYTNISLANPDTSLFQPPAGYQIVDIDGPAATIRMN